MSAMNRYLSTFLIVILTTVLAACSAGSGTIAISTSPAASETNRTTSPTPAPSVTLTAPPSPSPSPTRTASPIPSHTPTHTLTPTISSTPTITPTPTFTFPTITVLMQANCRYGPAKAYLYAWGMYAGDTGTVWGRNDSGTWLWIQPDQIKYQCWIAASVVEIHGDIFTLRVAPVRLPHSTLYGPPQGVNATRQGDTLVVTWNPVAMTEDDNRGYMIEANVCQNGNLVWLALATMDTTLSFTDETNCQGKSNGLLYTVEKHGYTDPVPIPWP